jgi:DCN1-like protein 1/2
MNAAVMCKFTRDEWVNGWVKMGVDSIDKLRAKLPELRADLRDANKWRDIYTYAYMWSREVRGQQGCEGLGERADPYMWLWEVSAAGERGR